MFRYFIALLACLVSAASLANDASFMGEGASVYAVVDNRVRMAKEVINIKFEKSGKENRWFADCRFTFVNETKNPVDVQMGFPDWFKFGEEPERDAQGNPVGDAWAIRKFTTTVNGETVATTHKEIKKPKDDDNTVNLPNKVKLAYDAAYTWKVHFGPKAKIEVHNTYSFGGFHSNGPVSACMYGRRKELFDHVFWRRAKIKPQGWDYEDSLCSVIEYIVTTGKTWKGSIGDAEISIALEPQTLPHLFVAVPPPTSVSAERVLWKFKNWKPTDELAVVYLRHVHRAVDSTDSDDKPVPPLFDTVAQAQAWATFARANGYKRDLARLAKNMIAAKHGYKFTDEKLAAFFKPFEWYAPKDGVNIAKLPAPDGEIFKVLEKLEKTLPL